jgi:sulfur carrier protein ThiS adenylyltransferase
MTSLFRQGLMRYFGEERLERLESARVAIVGAGGLGSNCAIHLVRSGVRRLSLCDFDRVEWSNLNRQYYFQDQVGRLKVEALAENLQRINPDLELSLCRDKLDASSLDPFLDGARIVVEAVDQAETKALIVETALKRQLPVVAASGLGGYGDSNRITGRAIGRHLFLVGDDVSEVGEFLPPWSSIVGIASAKQADAVIEWLLNQTWKTQDSSGEHRHDFIPA